MHIAATRLLLVSILAVGISFDTAPALAQSKYPARSIKLVVPNPPGGLPDLLSRTISDKLRARLGQPVVVENRPGANAGIGAALVAASKPDGYVFLVSDSAIINVSHHLNAQLPYNRNELEPITLIARAPIFLAASSRLPARTFAETVDHVRANPGKVNYGSIGVGSFHHLSMAAVEVELGLQLNHIPYKGSGESVTALRAGHIMLVLASLAGLQPAIKTGQARLIAVNAATRSRRAPDVPSIAETIPGFDLAVTQSLYARRGTPAAVAQRMTDAIAEILKLPDIIARFETMGIEPALAGPEALKTLLAAEAVRVERIVKAAGLKPH